MPATVRARGSRSGPDQPQPKPKSDAYVGLLLIALLAQIAGAVFLYLDYSQYPEIKVPASYKMGPTSGGAPPPPPPAAAQGVQGAMGAQGAAGVPGPMGAMGAMGAPGAMGAMGAMGAQGAMGAMGGPMGNPPPKM